MARLDDSHMRLFSLYGKVISLRDLIMIGGGVFLLIKGTMEIRDAIFSEPSEPEKDATASKFLLVILQIAIIDIVFSLDSVITAVGMADDVSIMITAVVIAVLVMLVSSGAIGDFVERHPTVKVLALSFLLLIGVSLTAEGAGQHVPKGYIYFAMGFSVFVEAINLRIRGKTEPVHLHSKYEE
jgi:predicted tellurium resistance membrane protein TerC